MNIYVGPTMCLGHKYEQNSQKYYFFKCISEYSQLTDHFYCISVQYDRKRYILEKAA